WAEGFQKQLEPITTFAGAIGDLREALATIAGPPAGGEGPAAGPDYTISPLEYDGKAPWMLHPQVVTIVGEQVKELMKYGADRLEGIMGKGPAPPMGEEEEEEEFMIPSLLDEAATEEAVEAPIEEVIEEEVEVPVEEIPVEEIIEEEVEVPAEEAAEVPVEEVTEEVEAEAPLEEAETIPSLLEEGLPCAQCGRTDVPLLPNGLCEKCVKEIAQGEQANE
ncbi:unnamed protein product, partial [marine sediment metagenome]